MQSAIFKGWVRHRRHTPKQHSFSYRIFMVLLDLSELDRVFSLSPWWSTRRWAPARFRRSDFLGDPSIPLDEAVRQRIYRETGDYPNGPIRMLANLRYFGFIMNPICCYYCFDADNRLQYIVAEVNNTPWNERHSYVLRCEPEQRNQRIQFDKRFHVSPFNPMDMRYSWFSSGPDAAVRIHMQNWQDSEQKNEERGDLVFDASLVLRREEMSAQTLNRLIWHYPLMTMKVVAGIYWEAVKLFCKRVPFYSHPGNQQATSLNYESPHSTLTGANRQ